MMTKIKGIKSAVINKMKEEIFRYYYEGIRGHLLTTLLGRPANREEGEGGGF